MKQALFYQIREDGSVCCELCHHRCVIKPDRRGICGVRENRGGKLFSLVYGAIAAEHIDPIEKKPLFHFLPGTATFSLATVGCNFSCLHCQNHTLSQASVDGDGGPLAGHLLLPESVVTAAHASGCRSISFTYSEPTVFYEFAYDCCLAAKGSDLRTVFVSNGYIGAGAANHLAPVLDAINIDIKAFSDQFYRRVCSARLQPVLDNVGLFHDRGVWVEVTTLVIPGLNDGDDELRGIAEFLVSIDPHIPWHVSGFHPTFQMLDRPPTPVELLRKARDIGMSAGLKNIYLGNVRGGGGEHTHCPGCGTAVISRNGYRLVGNLLRDGRCPDCGMLVAGVWR